VDMGERDMVEWLLSLLLLAVLKQLVDFLVIYYLLNSCFVRSRLTRVNVDSDSDRVVGNNRPPPVCYTVVLNFQKIKNRGQFDPFLGQITPDLDTCPGQCYGRVCCRRLHGL
jgi:hypothetical protein